LILREASNSRLICEAELRRSLTEADLPILLMAQVQMTGDAALLDEYAPSIARLLCEGTPVSSPMVARLHDLITETLLNPPPAPDCISPALMQKMMSTCVGQNVPAEYVPMMMQDLGFEEPLRLSWREIGERMPEFRVLVIGAGAGGLCAAIQLKQSGLHFDVVEKNPNVGGTWFENRYPGAGVDAPNHLYSYSFEPGHSWTRFFVKQKELQDYFRDCVRRHELDDRIHFNTETISAVYDVPVRKWRVRTRGPEGDREWVVDCVISAVGQLNRPSIPAIEGLDRFTGPAFHTARWPNDLDIFGKRVALIGTGASGMQVGPTIAPDVERLTIFQRSPNWIRTRPRYHETVPAGKKWALEHIPSYRAWYRFQLFWANSDALHAALQKEANWTEPLRSVSRLNEELRKDWATYFEKKAGNNPELLRKTLPDYPPFGKRPLLDNNWFEMLARDNVELVTTPVARVTPNTVQTRDGLKYPADVIVFATGFQASRMLFPMDVRGTSGDSLRELWGEDNPRAYLGILVPDYPNFFVLYGPNTNLGHGGSVIFHLEIQVRYVMNCLKLMAEGGFRSLECRQDVHDAYNDKVDVAHERMVWTHAGVNNWYKNSAGRVTANSPWRIVDYWTMARQPEPDDFILK
jgi:4-hydroxyacetophenone monooxygenase